MSILLRKALHDHGIRVKELADYANLSAWKASRILSGTVQPSVDEEIVINRFCELVGIDTADIFESCTWYPNGKNRVPRKLKAIMEAAGRGISYRSLARELKKRGISITNETIRRMAHGSTIAMHDARLAIEQVLSERVPELLADRGITEIKQIWEREKPFRDLKNAKAGRRPVQITQANLTDQVLDWFGLERDPFEDPETPADMFMPREIETLGEEVLDAVLKLKFVGVTGRTGCGKSVLKQMIVFRKLANRSDIFLCALQSFRKERVTSRHLLTSILLTLDQEARVPSDDERLARRIISLLADIAGKGKRAILVVDEAHALSVEALRALKRLYEFHKEVPDFGYRRAVGIFLVGQAELGPKLKARTLDEVRRRMIVFDMGKPGIAKSSSKAGITSYRYRYAGKYALKRLEAASRNGRARTILEPDALRILGKLAITPLDVNAVLSNAMKIAYGRESRKVTREMLEKAARG